MQLIVRFFVTLFAFWVASLAAAAVMVLGAAPELPRTDDFPLLTVFIFTVSAFVAAFSFVPAVIAILVTETFGLRSVVLHAVAGGLIGLFCGYTLGVIGPLPRFDFDMPLGTNFELLAAAGIAAGLIYWLIAGRSAGLWRERPEPAR
ncbi:MAG TPA: hypothetical protein VFY21_10090 [Xanthobacteraceae bacterium]|nr:hypothetical protein [Xanthobacteraceae bacterium]